MQALCAIGLCLLGLFVVLVFYGIAATALSRMPMNANFQKHPGGIPVAIIDNGVHVDILTPVAGLDHDWRRVLPEGAVPENVEWLGFGWGSRDFYLNTPTWDDFSIWNGAKALAGIGGTTVRVQFREILLEAPNVTVIRLDPVRFALLRQAITAAMVLNADGRAAPILHPGYGDDLFLEAYGRYSPILTCNEWASRVLAKAGVRTAYWSPFPNGVIPPAAE